MNSKKKTFLLVAVFVTVIAGLFANGQFAMAGGEDSSKKTNKGFTDEFFLEDCNFLSTGSNKFFILEPDYQLVLNHEKKSGNIELTITVLNETKDIQGIETRVVEERETEGGELVEISRNYYAICEQTNSVFYFGEDVDFYEKGQIVGHDGSWLAGENNAEAGVMMPGIVLLGSKYQQETAPSVAMDRAQIESMTEKVKTPIGVFEGVLKIKETTPLEKTLLDHKYYASGIGMIQENKHLKLTQYGFID